VAAAGLTYPLVVKPVRGAGSQCVQRVDNAAELTHAATRFQADLRARHFADMWGDDGLQVEEYIAGPEVDIDLLLFHGEVRYARVSDNFPPVEPWFLERGGRLPSLLSTAEQQGLIDMAVAVLQALGVTHGCVHFEARLSPRGPMPIEVNLRLGGAEVCAFHWGAFGVNLLEQAVRLALDLPPTLGSAVAPRAYCVSTNFVPTQAGHLRHIHVAPEVFTSLYCVELVIFREVGDLIRVPPDGFDYCGWLVASGESPETAAVHLAELTAGIQFAICP
jgi:biotin carboxylase